MANGLVCGVSVSWPFLNGAHTFYVSHMHLVVPDLAWLEKIHPSLGNRNIEGHQPFFWVFQPKGWSWGIEHQISCWLWIIKWLKRHSVSSEVQARRTNHQKPVGYAFRTWRKSGSLSKSFLYFAKEPETQCFAWDTNYSVVKILSHNFSTSQSQPSPT